MVKRSRHAADVRIHDLYSCIERYISTRIHSLSITNDVIQIMARDLITRVELNDADDSNYGTLHSATEAGVPYNELHPQPDAR
jgi:hypothetical protein